MKLAALQMNSGNDTSANLQAAEQLLQQARDAGAALAVLPENFALMSERRAERIALAAAVDRYCDELARMAAGLGIWIVAGSLPVPSAEPDRPYTSSFVFDDTGKQVGRYDKIHLFDVQVSERADEAYAESSYTRPGTAPLVVETPWGRLGVGVCYDLRFPELFRTMLAGGLDLLAVPAAFTHATGQAHWELLLRARATENLVHVVAAAQTGEHPGRRHTWGHAMIVDPWGEVLADAGTSPGMAVAPFDRQRQERLRAEFPVLEHRH